MFWQKFAVTESSIPDLLGKWKIINICLIQTLKIWVSNFSYYHKTFQRKMLKKEGLYKHHTDQVAEYNHFQCSQPYSLGFGWSCGGPGGRLNDPYGPFPVFRMFWFYDFSTTSD